MTAHADSRPHADVRPRSVGDGAPDARPSGRAARRHGADHGRRRTRCCAGADVLVVGDRDRRRRARPRRCPRAPGRSTPRGGIVMPGMIDTHRHMWQTAMRGYGADWTLTQYFVWYYLEYGKRFRPEDVHAGQPARRARGARRRASPPRVDWSHGLQTVDHADAAVDALRGGARPLRARLRQHPAGARGSGRPRRSSAPSSSRRIDAATTCSASRWPSTSPATRRSPSRPAFEVARELGVPVTTHAGVWGATNDDGIRLMHEHGFMTRRDVYVHAATLSRRLLPPHRRHRRLGVGLHRERAERRPGLPAHLGSCARTASRCRCRWTPACGGAATCSPRCAPRSAPTAPASTSRRTPKGETVTNRAPARRAGRRLGHPRRRPGARPGRRPRQPRGRARRPTSC